MKEAQFWEKKDDRVAHCHLCPQHCVIREGRSGFCRVRKNEGGVLYTLNYSRVASYALDPTEKKPLYHFYPGSHLFSLGSVGCNLRCGFCQNWQISQKDAPTIDVAPDEAVRWTLRARRQEPGCIGLAYTYSEPSMWFEYVLDTAWSAKQEGLKNVMVTNGYVNEEPFRKLLPFIDAFNIDVKGFTEDFYRKICIGRRDPVLETVEMARDAGKHVEVTNLLIPGKNDSPEEIEAMVDWLASVDPDIPLHFSRYFPNYKMDIPPTPLSTLERAREIAVKKLRYVYLGNAWGNRWNNTYCPSCGEAVILRSGMGVRQVALDEGKCTKCGNKIAVVI